MKDGDIIEWRGANITHRARVTESGNGELLATLENGRTFRLGDLLYCKSLKTIENGSIETTQAEKDIHRKSDIVGIRG